MEIVKEHKPSFECMNVAEASLEYALRASDTAERYHHLSTGYVFIAFAIEAMFVFYRSNIDNTYDQKSKKSTADLFKETMNLVGIRGYFGSTDGQSLMNCLAIRDRIAHGHHEVNKITLPDIDDLPASSRTTSILSLPSAPFNKLTIKELSFFIELAKRTDLMIYEKGSDKEGYQLISAFACSGRSSW